MQERSISFTNNSQELTPQEQTRWKVCCELAKQKMHGTQEQKEAIIQKRILRFSQNYKLNQSSYYVPRKNIDQNQLSTSKIDNTVLIIFGIDFLSPGKIDSYFAPYKIDSVILDQSHCAIRFQNTHALLQALFLRLIQKPQSIEVLQKKIYFGNQSEVIQWREIQGYSEMGIQRKLWARFALVSQLIATKQIDEQKMDSMNLAKRMFIKQFERQQRSRNTKKQRRSEKLQYGFTKKFQEMGRERETSQKCCCHKRFNKIIETLKCNCGKGDRQKSRDRLSERERTREKHKKGRRQQIVYRGLDNIGKPLDIIKEFTQPNQSRMSVQSLSAETNKFQTTPSQSFSCGIPRIPNKQNSTDVDFDKSFSDMVKELQRYQISEDLESQLESEQHLANKGSMNKSQYSMFELDKSEDDEE